MCKFIKIVILGVSLVIVIIGCATISKYWTVISAPQETGQKFAKITEKEDLLDTSLPFVISKDGEKIAFTSWKSGNGDLYVKKLTGGKALLQRSYRNETENHPCFSPDGSQIVFSAYRDGGYHIYLIGAEAGSAIRQITSSSPANAEYPTFSPDGQIIAFNSIEYSWSESGNVRTGEYIWTYDIKTGALIQYTEGVMPKFTSDGKNVVFKRARKTGKNLWYELWMTNMETGAETNIMSGEDFGVAHFDVSPDGKKIVFSSDKGTKEGGGERKNLNIWTVDVDGSNLTQLTFHLSDDLWPRWAPDMSGIYFLSTRGEPDKETVNVWKISY